MSQGHGDQWPQVPPVAPFSGMQEASRRERCDRRLRRNDYGRSVGSNSSPATSSEHIAAGLPSSIELRPYQQRIAARAVDLFCGCARDRHGHHEEEAHSVLIESPTGSGKTVMALMLARHMQKQLGMSVGWTAMRRNLLVQAKTENARGFGVEMQLMSMFEKHPPQVDLLIVDEAQHDAAMSMANLHSCIKPKKILGLTATPYRNDCFKLCFQKVIRDAGIHQLIQDGYLSPYLHYTIPRYTPQAVADVYAREPDRWGQSLVFFQRYDQCRACCEELAARGVQAEVVTAKTDRQQQIDMFEAGEIRVLLSMLVLAEGFDCPPLKTVFCRPSGRLCTVQMCGRVLRKHPDLRFKQIVQCDRTRHPFPRTASPAEQYLWHADGWRALTVNRHLEAMCQKMQHLVATLPVTLPEFLRPKTPSRSERRPFRRYQRGRERSISHGFENAPWVDEDRISF